MKDLKLLVPEAANRATVILIVGIARDGRVAGTQEPGPGKGAIFGGRPKVGVRAETDEIAVSKPEAAREGIKIVRLARRAVAPTMGLR